MKVVNYCEIVDFAKLEIVSYQPLVVKYQKRNWVSFRDSGLVSYSEIGVPSFETTLPDIPEFKTRCSVTTFVQLPD